MWEPLPLTTLEATTACNRAIFTFIFSAVRIPVMNKAEKQSHSTTTISSLLFEF
jgi:hypothetical protein